MRKRSAAGSSPNASPASTATSRSLEQVRRRARAPEREAAAPAEVGIEVEGAARRPAARAGGDHDLVGGAAHRAVQATARVDVRDDLRRLTEHVLGRVLHRRRRCGPDLARQPAERRAGLLAEQPVGQPHEPDAPAAERQVLAQAGGDERALGRTSAGLTKRSGSYARSR